MPAKREEVYIRGFILSCIFHSRNTTKSTKYLLLYTIMSLIVEPNSSVAQVAIELIQRTFKLGKLALKYLLGLSSPAIEAPTLGKY